MSEFYMSDDKGWRMYSSGGVDNGLDQYFIVNTSNSKVEGVTDSPSGITWSKPHVHIPTRGIELENIQIVNEDNNWYVVPVDSNRVTHQMPDITQCIQGINS